MPKRYKVMSGTLREPTQGRSEYLGATAVLAAGADREAPHEANMSPAFLNKLQRKLAFVLAVATFQEASGAPIIRGSQVKQAESTIDQLCNRLLEGIPAHHNHAIIVAVLTRNAQPKLKWDCDQSRHSGTRLSLNKVGKQGRLARYLSQDTR